MKLRNVTLGSRAIKRVSLPLMNWPSPLAPDVQELADQRVLDAGAALSAGKEPAPASIDIGVRVLLPGELATVYEKAGEFARNKGAKALNDQDPIWNLAVSVYMCAAACVDPDTSASDPDPAFGERGDLESAALELFQSPHVGRDGLQYLTSAHELWQDQCSPSVLRVSPRVLEESCRKLASDDDNEAFATFLAMRPGMQWRCMRFMAAQLSILQMLKLSSLPLSPDTSSSGSSEQPATSLQ